MDTQSMQQPYLYQISMDTQSIQHPNTSPICIKYRWILSQCNTPVPTLSVSNIDGYSVNVTPQYQPYLYQISMDTQSMQHPNTNPICIKYRWILSQCSNPICIKYRWILSQYSTPIPTLSVSNIDGYSANAATQYQPYLYQISMDTQSMQQPNTNSICTKYRWILSQCSNPICIKYRWILSQYSTPIPTLSVSNIDGYSANAATQYQPYLYQISMDTQSMQHPNTNPICIKYRWILSQCSNPIPTLSVSNIDGYSVNVATQYQPYLYQISMDTQSMQQPNTNPICIKYRWILSQCSNPIPTL